MDDLFDTHALEAIWVKILRTVRNDKNYALFGLLSTLNDVAFVDGKICIHTHNDAEKTMLNHHLAELQTMAGGDIITLQDDTVAPQTNDRDIVARLKDLFGDKVEIV